VALSDLELELSIWTQQWTKQNWCIGGYWVTQAGFFRLLCCLKLMLTWMEGWALHQVSPLKGGPFPNASSPQVVGLSRGPSFREGQALPQYFFGHGQLFFKCFLFFLETNGQNPLQGEWAVQTFLNLSL
jgi:hypothetical protein